MMSQLESKPCNLNAWRKAHPNPEPQARLEYHSSQWGGWKTLTSSTEHTPPATRRALRDSPITANLQTGRSNASRFSSSIEVPNLISESLQ